MIEEVAREENSNNDMKNKRAVLLKANEANQVVTAKKSTLVDEADASSKKRKMTIADDESHENPVVFANDSDNTKIVPHNSKVLGLVPVNENHLHLPQRLLTSDDVAVRPNTAYIYCSEAQQVQSTTNGNTANSNSGYPENIALLIPSSVLNATSDPRFDASLLEVSCHVLNMHFWPLQNISTRS